MVKFKKTIAMGMLAAATLMATGAVALHAAPAVTAYASEAGEGGSGGGATETKETPTVTTGNFAYLTYDTTKLKGNFIYVEYFADLAKPSKSTIVYTKDELPNGQIPIGGMNLKKGGFFKVYDELTDKDTVEAFEIDKQTDKIKVKVDLSQTELLKVFKITVGTTEITADNLGDYDIFFNGSPIATAGPAAPAAEGAKAALVPNEDLLTQLKVAARSNGLTVYVECCTGNGMPSEGKFKIAAAPKAPKVTVDYVNGEYVLPKGVSYIATEATAAGITAPDAEAKWTATTAKVSLPVADILEAAKADGATAAPSLAGLIVKVPADKKAESVWTVYKIEKLDDAKFTASADTKTGSIKIGVASDGTGGTEVAKLTFSKTGVIIEATADIAYWDSAKNKYAVLKKGKKTAEITLANDGTATLDVKVLGTKATKTEPGKFGTAAVSVTNSFKEESSATGTPSPTP